MSRMPPAQCPLLVLVGLLLIICTCLATPVAAQTWDTIPVNPRVQIEYREPTSEKFKGVYASLKERKILEELQHFLVPLNLPHTLRLVTLECGYINAFYSLDERSLNICYEFVAYEIDNAPKTVSEDGFVTRQAAIVGDLVGTILHEGGHMLFDMLDVPVFGREEDAADEMASFLALQFNKDVARTIVKGFAYFWAKQKDPAASAPISAWSDEHGSASQRMYNALCLGYGGDPQTFKEFVERGWLPKKRAVHCDQEYTQLKNAFVKTVLPFIDQDLMLRVQHTQWLTADELK
jgi:putative metallopeptidase DUF4344